MTGANEVLGCPQVKKISLSIHLQKFLTTFFRNFSKFVPLISIISMFFYKSPPKILTTFLKLISHNVYLNFYTSFRMPLTLDARGRHLLSLDF